MIGTKTLSKIEQWILHMFIALVCKTGEIGSKNHMLTCIQDVKSQTKCHYENFTESAHKESKNHILCKIEGYCVMRGGMTKE